MTFSNRREPSFDGVEASPAHAPAKSAAHEIPHLGAGEAAAHRAAPASRLSRMVSTVQIVGSLLAVPLGLASGYSMYKANFAPDTTCQNLRGNIIAMLDKNVDASTRRMLVRRDVSTFEQNCASFDPDAHAAFKVLLAAPAPAANAAAPKLRVALPANDVPRKAESKSEPKAEAKAEAKSEPKADTKSELRQAVAEKAPAVAPASIEAIEREAAVSDTRWLAAVRQALVTHGPATDGDETAAVEPRKGLSRELGRPEQKLDAVLAQPARASAPAIVKAQPAPPPAAPSVQLQPAWNVPAPVVAGTPAVEPPARATSVLDDHPVPPAAIPGTTLAPTPVSNETKPAAESRFGSWIAQIPLVGRVIEPRRN